MSLLIIHVDDGLIASSTEAMNTDVLDLLREEYALHDCGVPRMFVGMDMEYDHKSRRLAICSSTY